jgi:hypothetical protein
VRTPARSSLRFSLPLRKGNPLTNGNGRHRRAFKAK